MATARTWPARPPRAGATDGGVAGVAWHAAIMPLKVLDDDGQGRVSDGIWVYRYAAANGARVLNLRLSGDPFSRADALRWLPPRGRCS